MNELRAMQITRAAEARLAGCERNEAALLTTGQSGKAARKLSRAACRARLSGPANKDDHRRGAAGNANGSRRGKHKPAAASGNGSGSGQADVESVAELIAIICLEPGNRKKRLKLAEALRERGLDESKVAATYSGLAEKLSRNKEEGAVGVAAAKLLFDVLKELADCLEPQRTAGNSDAGEAPQFVRLIHNVPRPVRTE
ncbi:MAG: hypothetical protein WBS17_14555 [Candidatus Acidiferrales bacterium]